MSKTQTQQNGWREVKLGEIMRIFTGRKDVNQTKIDGRYDFFSCSPDKYYSDEFICDDYALIITGNGSFTGTVRFYSGKFDLYQRTYACVLNEEAKRLYEPKFIYYFTKEVFEKKFMGGTRGSSIPYIVRGDIENFLIPSPPLPEQKAIAEVLSSIDDKIDLLHHQNKNLEDIAQALFRKWFVEEAKEDWEEKPLDEIVVVSSGKGLKKSEYNPNGNYSVLGANGEIGKTDKYLNNEKLIFTGRVGTLGNVFILDNKAWLSDNTLIIKTDQIYFYFVYFLLKNAKLESYNVGSTQPLIRQSDIKTINILLPDSKTLNKFELQASLFFERIKHNQSQIRTLENLRDTLLPKLISGAAKVKL